MRSIEGELAWAAGFYDGEGCTNVKTGPWGPALRLLVSQNDLGPLNRFHAAVGVGGIRRRTWAKPRKDGTPGTLAYEWRVCTARGTMEVLAVLWKYLGRPKRLQALLKIDKVCTGRFESRKSRRSLCLTQVG